MFNFTLATLPVNFPFFARKICQHTNFLKRRINNIISNSRIAQNIIPEIISNGKNKYGGHCIGHFSQLTYSCVDHSEIILVNFTCNGTSFAMRVATFSIGLVHLNCHTLTFLQSGHIKCLAICRDRLQIFTHFD